MVVVQIYHSVLPFGKTHNLRERNICHKILYSLFLGADVVQGFDSRIGAVSPSVYRRFVQPSMKRIFAAIQETGAPQYGSNKKTVDQDSHEQGNDAVKVAVHF